MICEIFPLRPRLDGSAPTVTYVLGMTTSKRGHDAEACHYLTDSGLALADAAGGEGSKKGSFSNHYISTETSQALDSQAKRNKKVRKPIWHAVVSLAPEDKLRLNESDWSHIAHTFMERMGFSACKWLAALHLDTDKPHIHVVACTVQDAPGYPAVKRYGDYRRAENLMRELEQEYNLRTVPSPEASFGINHAQRKTGKAALREVIDHCVDVINGAPYSPDITDLVKNLQLYGVNTRCQWREGQPRGISFEMDDWKSSGSKLGGNGAYSLAGLCSRGVALVGANTLDELWEMTTSGLSRPAHESRPPLSVEEGEADARDDSEITRSFRVAISLPTAAAKALETSSLITQPAHADYFQREAIWEYRVAITGSPRSKDDSTELMRVLVGAILRLVEQLLQMLGFNIVLTSTAASFFPDDFAEPVEIRTVSDKEAIEETVRAQLTDCTADQTFEDYEELRPRGEDPSPT